MSNSVAIVTEFSDWNNFVTALDKLNWKTKQNSKIRTYSGDSSRNKIFGTIAINPNPSGYDVGIEVDSNGKITLVCDFNSSISNTLGYGFSKLKTQYVIAAAQQNYQELISQEQFADGSIIVELDDGQ